MIAILIKPFFVMIFCPDVPDICVISGHAPVSTRPGPACAEPGDGCGSSQVLEVRLSAGHQGRSDLDSENIRDISSEMRSDM